MRKRGRGESPEAADFEQRHVHDVYESVAGHFSATRYRGWPRVCAFLEALPDYACVADVGCGNGKYFTSAQTREGGAAHRLVVGLDRCEALLRSTQRVAADPNFDPQLGPGHRTRRARRRGEAHAAALPRTDVVRCDAGACPLRAGVADAAVSIAVLHHYATAARRRAAARELLRVLRPDGGRALVYVWALEPRLTAAPSDKWDLRPDTGDALVGWRTGDGAAQLAQPQSLQRFYHLFREGELEQLMRDAAAELGAAVEVEESYFDKENWCLVVRRLPTAPAEPSA